jgi:outer membrane protein assembly factor BamA
MTVEITGNVFFSSKYLLGDIANISNQKAAERLIADILDEYNNAGFPFCTIIPELQYDDNRRSRLILTIEEGQRVIIEELLLSSDGNTDVNAARRIASFKRGEHFSSRTLALAKNRLMSTNAFERIGERVVDRDGMYYLHFFLTEKESDILSLSGSLSGTDIEFGASFSSFNLLGTLRQLNFNYEYQRLFSLQFREPVLIAPAMLDADFAIWTHDTARLIEGHIRFSAPIGELFTIVLLSGIEYVNYYESDSVTHQSSDNLLGIGTGFDYRAPDWSNLQTLYLDYLYGRTTD